MSLSGGLPGASGSKGTEVLGGALPHQILQKVAHLGMEVVLRSKLLDEL